jgi:formylglycine-generating enzyme required for sulfatase activity
MTKIYTTNTLEVYSDSQDINTRDGDALSLSVDIKINWVDQSSAQRILFYQWESSLDSGVTWTQILAGKNVSLFDDHSADTIYTNSYLINGDLDLKWANFNLFNDKQPKAYLDFNRIVATQNQTKYRCNVFLYNIDFNFIDSAATSDSFTLYVTRLKSNIIPETDILWDAVPNKKISNQTLLDQNTTIKIFNPAGGAKNVDILLNGIKIISDSILPTSSGNALSINLSDYQNSYDPLNPGLSSNPVKVIGGINTLTIQQSQRNINLSVNPAVSWQSTGFSVTNGMKLIISANGSVVWGAGSVGPQGLNNEAFGIPRTVNVDSRFNHGALLGRVGGNIFLIGNYFIGTMSSAGTLELITNDTVRQDNSGSFAVTIVAPLISITPISIIVVKSDGTLIDLSTLQKTVTINKDANGNFISNTINSTAITNSDPFSSAGAVNVLFNFEPAPSPTPSPTATLTPTPTTTSVTPTPTSSVGSVPTPTPSLSVSATPTPTPTITTSPTNNTNPGVNSANWTSNSNWDGTDTLSPSGNVTSVGTNGGPSAYGTYDMSGNAREWVGDLSPWFTVDSNINRTIMGTSFQSVTACSSRDRTSDYVDAQSYYSDSLSFRVMTIDNPYSYNNFVTVSDINNNPDTEYYSSSYQMGSVSYVYKIGKYKVTNTEYVAFLNSIAATDTNSVYLSEMSAVRGGINRSGSSGSYSYSVKNNYGNKPVNNLTWFSALRYCNWLHNNKPTGAQSPSTTEDGAYTRVAIDPQLPAANSGAKYRLPRTTEWWKAAYYAGGGTSSAYWDYATQSDNTPSGAGCNEFGVGPV